MHNFSLLPLCFVYFLIVPSISILFRFLLSFVLRLPYISAWDTTITRQSHRIARSALKLVALNSIKEQYTSRTQIKLMLLNPVIHIWENNHNILYIYIASHRRQIPLLVFQNITSFIFGLDVLRHNTQTETVWFFFWWWWSYTCNPWWHPICIDCSIGIWL